jgi:hypothetical protein
VADIPIPAPAPPDLVTVIPDVRARSRLVCASFLMLFVELALIRWTAANNIHLAYLTNFVLLASFLGIGVGFLRAHSPRALLGLAAIGLAALVAFVLAFPVSLIKLSGQHQLSAAFGLQPLPRWLRLGVIFTLTVVVMGGIAHTVARTFSRFRPLEAYRLDIIGSLAGIAVFSALSFAQLPPIAWGLVGAFPGASGAFAINNKGIFGGSLFDSGTTGLYSPYIASTQTKKELFLWKPTGGSGVVLALNDQTIAGGSVTDAGGTRGALWWGAQHSTLGPATTPSTIRSVNRRGWAVGDLGTPGSTRAALFLGRRTIDLSNRVPGYTLVRGDAINDKGWILADGRNAQGQLHAFLLRPKTRRK